VLAIDTNVIVRYLTGDDPAQFAKASALIGSKDVFVCATVLLETEWVLRRAYRFSRERVIAALTAFAGLPRVMLEDPPVAAQALAWSHRGMDFADALHLAKVQECEALITFDQRFARLAGDLSRTKVLAP
jgi:predicted nucleic-acid-binding protein